MPNPIHAISPIDGRYFSKVKDLSAYFSEGAVIQYRIGVEVEYFIHLVEIPLPQLKDFPKERYGSLRALYQDFTPEMAKEVLLISCEVKPK